MSELSPQARSILDAGRAAMTPAEAVRIRVRAAVDARVAGSVAGASAAGGGGMVKLVVLSCVGLAVVGAVVVAWRTSRPAGDVSVVRKVESAAPPAARSANAAPQPIVTELAPEQPAARQRPRPPSAEPAPDLAKELAMLEEARAALRAGTPADAIAALDRHRREIRSPQLEREALLLRAEALCAQGDREEGERMLDEIVGRWPGAAGVHAVRSRCGH